MSVFLHEIEAIISRRPAVIGCGIVGKIDEEKGEIPVAFVQLNPEYQDHLSEGESHTRRFDQMAVYKVPIIKFIEELPLTAAGAVKK